MRLQILFLLSFLEVLSCIAQESTSIIGKWKIVAAMDNEFYHHFDKDSTVLNNNFKLTLVAYKKDTVEAISAIKFSMRVFENTFYIFKFDSTYQNIIGTASTEEGKFHIDYVKKQILTTAIGDTGVKQEEINQYKLNKNKLELTMASENSDTIFYIEKL